jgi:uncharacterized membrane protein
LNFSLKLAVAIQIVTVVTILLDIPVARQIVGFIYISFFPGFLILKILKLGFKSPFEELPFTVGLSIAFSMFTGLAANELYPLLGISEPLSVLPLLLTMGAILTVLTFVVGRKQVSNHVSSANSYSLPSRKQIVPFALLAVVPFLSIFGALYHSSLALLLMAGTIALLVIVALFFRKSLPSTFFPIFIVIVAVSLIFQRELISQNLLGYDTFGEFYVFNATNTHSFWNASLLLTQPELRDYNSMLSVTILPTMYSKLMNISGEWIFKILYFLLYAFVPLSMYYMYKQNFGKATGFLAAFYFVLFPRFYGEERRQIVGELFLVLLLFTIISSSISLKKKQLLIGVFGIALAVSHYSTFDVFVFCSLFAVVAILLAEKLPIIKHPPKINKILSTRIMLVILAFGIIWFTFASTSLDQTFISFVTRLVNSFQTGFSNVGSRGNTVSDFVSPTLNTTTLTYKADYYINKIPYFLLGIGVIAFIKNRKKLSMQAEYFPMAIGALLILILTFVLPSLADSFVEERFYHLALIFLAPICFYGGITVLTWVSKHFMHPKRARTLAIGILCVLFVVIFLFKVGFVNEVAVDLGPGASPAFSFTHMVTSQNPGVLAAFYSEYVPDCDVNSAKWLSVMTPSNSTLYADADARQHVLRGYALRVVDGNNILSNGTIIAPNSFVYLRYLNVQGYFVDSKGAVLNMTLLNNQLENADKIYSNGYSEIYFSNIG